MTMTDETQNPEYDVADEGETPEDVIARLEAEVAEWKNQALRAAAETENTKRRGEREMNDARAYAIQKFARDLLGVADNLSRALQASPQTSDSPALKNLALGIELTEKELLGAFERNGLRRLEPATGDKFDPNLHQAMMEQPSTEVGAGAVINTLQAGYELFGRVVRPAMVIVASKDSRPAGADAYGKAAAGNGEAFDTKA
jgi:molecular chaperone GrpE